MHGRRRRKERRKDGNIINRITSYESVDKRGRGGNYEMEDKNKRLGARGPVRGERAAVRVSSGNITGEEKRRKRRKREIIMIRGGKKMVRGDY